MANPEQPKMSGKEQNREKIKSQFFEILEKGRKKEEEKKEKEKKEGEESKIVEKHLPDELRVELIKTVSDYFEKILIEVYIPDKTKTYDPDKILSNSDKENIFNETKNKIKELKDKFPDQFKKTLLIQHEILTVFGRVTDPENLQWLTLENHEDICKGLAMMMGLIELPPKLKFGLYDILNKGIPSRVRKDQISEVFKMYGDYFPDKNLWEEVERAKTADKKSAEKIKLGSLNRIREEMKTETEK